MIVLVTLHRGTPERQRPLRLLDSAKGVALTDRGEEAPAEERSGYTSRRRFLQGAAGTMGVLGASLAAPGVFYKMADAIAATPARPAVGTKTPPQEQYLLQNTQVINVDGSGLHGKHGSVAIHVPPL